MAREPREPFEASDPSELSEPSKPDQQLNLSDHVNQVREETT